MAKRQANPDKINMFTPRGVLKYPKLNEPDHGTEKFPCSHEWGDYKTRAIFDRSARGVEAFIAKIDKAMARAQELAEEGFAELDLKNRKALEAKGGISPDLTYSEIYDEDTEEATGQIEMLFKMRAGGIRKKDNKEWTAKPDLFDAKGKPLAKKVSIWGGSVGILNFDLEPYFMPGTGKYGLSRRMNAVQIVELVSSGGNKSASSYGFGEEEGFDGSEYEGDADEDGQTDGDAEGGDSADPNF
jgi:hypothetical protein